MHGHRLLTGLLALVIGLGAACAPQSTPTPQPTPTAEPTPATFGLNTWDLVVITDSAGWGMADILAARLQELIGVPVTAHDFATGTLSAAELRALLDGAPVEDFRLSRLPAALPEAEMVVLLANPLSLAQIMPGDWNCFPGQGQPYVTDCTAENYDQYRDDLGAIYDAVFALRGDQPLIFRALDNYVPLYAYYRTEGVLDECRGCWETLNAVIHETAAAHHVPVVSLFDAFNGPNHDEDPREKGYIREDGMHTTPEGAAAMAEAILAYGLGVTPRP